MKCINCGKEIPDGKKFCPECGASQTVQYGGNAQGDNNIPGANASAPSGKPSGKISVLSIIALVISFFGIIGFVGTILGIIDLATDRQKKNKHVLSIIAIVIGLIATVIGASGSSASDTSDKKTSAGTTVESSVSASADDAAGSASSAVSDAAGSAASSEAASDATSFEKGQEYKDKNISVTMTDCGLTTDDQISEYAEIPDGCKIVYASFSAKNVGKDSCTIMYGDFNGFADDSACDQFYSLEGLGKCGMDFSSELSAGRKIDGTVAFAVPEDATKLEIEYKPNILLDKVIVFKVPLN